MILDPSDLGQTRVAEVTLEIHLYRNMFCDGLDEISPCWYVGYNQFRHPVQRYAATQVIAEQRCQECHPRRSRLREIRTWTKNRFS